MTSADRVLTGSQTKESAIRKLTRLFRGATQVKPLPGPFDVFRKGLVDITTLKDNFQKTENQIRDEDMKLADPARSSGEKMGLAAAKNRLEEGKRQSEKGIRGLTAVAILEDFIRKRDADALASGLAADNAQSSLTDLTEKQQNKLGDNAVDLYAHLRILIGLPHPDGKLVSNNEHRLLSLLAGWGYIRGFGKYPPNAVTGLAFTTSEEKKRFLADLKAVALQHESGLRYLDKKPAPTAATPVVAQPVAPAPAATASAQQAPTPKPPAAAPAAAAAAPGGHTPQTKPVKKVVKPSKPAQRVPAATPPAAPTPPAAAVPAPAAPVNTTPAPAPAATPPAQVASQNTPATGTDIAALLKQLDTIDELERTFRTHTDVLLNTTAPLQEWAAAFNTLRGDIVAAAKKPSLVQKTREGLAQAGQSLKQRAEYLRGHKTHIDNPDLQNSLQAIRTDLLDSLQASRQEILDSSLIPGEVLAMRDALRQARHELEQAPGLAGELATAREEIASLRQARSIPRKAPETVQIISFMKGSDERALNKQTTGDRIHDVVIKSLTDMQDSALTDEQRKAHLEQLEEFLEAPSDALGQPISIPYTLKTAVKDLTEGLARIPDPVPVADLQDLATAFQTDVSDWRSRMLEKHPALKMLQESRNQAGELEKQLAEARGQAKKDLEEAARKLKEADARIQAERTAAEEKLDQINKQIPDLVAQRTAELSDALKTSTRERDGALQERDAALRKVAALEKARTPVPTPAGAPGRTASGPTGKPVTPPNAPAASSGTGNMAAPAPATPVATTGGKPPATAAAPTARPPATSTAAQVPGTPTSRGQFVPGPVSDNSVAGPMPPLPALAPVAPVTAPPAPAAPVPAAQAPADHVPSGTPRNGATAHPFDWEAVAHTARKFVRPTQAGAQTPGSNGAGQGPVAARVNGPAEPAELSDNEKMLAEMFVRQRLGKE
ncbi:MAG: hypothetical protein M3O22_00145, partial [Pseudomonadota bacterium]|nr:hypothetical protein [Pseudomonadota bacterium]